MKTFVSSLLMTSRNWAITRAAQCPYTLTCYRLAGMKATDSLEIKFQEKQILGLRNQTARYSSRRNLARYARNSGSLWKRNIHVIP
ncbi:unnamed protein product, partial [Mesorhabditis spiculigera]